MKIYASTLDSSDRRQHDRLYHHMNIKLTTKAKETVKAHTINLSDGGLLIECDINSFMNIGDVMEVQSIDFPDAPVNKVIVKRISETNQMGVQFI